MFHDELPNIPRPKMGQYFAEARGLGVSTCSAAQASSQLYVVYDGLQDRAIRGVMPATLIMYGAHEEELMGSAAFWAGKTTCSHQTYGHNLDGTSSSQQFGNALESEELRPRSMGQARLHRPRKRPGAAPPLRQLVDRGDQVGRHRVELGAQVDHPWSPLSMSKCPLVPCALQ
jgi:hypothetical protein